MQNSLFVYCAALLITASIALAQDVGTNTPAKNRLDSQIARTSLLETVPQFVSLPQISDVLCPKHSEKAASTDFTEVFWQAGLNIAQVEGGTVDYKGTSSGIKEYIKVQAISLAQRHQHKFYTFGYCSPQKAWYATLPVAENLMVNQNTVFLSLKKLSQQCHNIEIAYAEISSPKVTRIASKGISKIITKDFVPGFLGVSCTPKGGTLGPQLIYLVPVKTTYQDALQKLDLTSGNLLAWINRVRKKLDLSELSSDGELDSLARNLVKARTLAHFHQETLEKTGKLRRELGYQDIRELKARGKSPDEIKKFLWFSPFHRLALIDPAATNLGLAEENIQGSYSVVLFTSRKNAKL